jgi:tagaturonate reductase
MRSSQLSFPQVLKLFQVSLSGVLPALTAAFWPATAYSRDQLPERVLQFGSGMLLRALCAAAVDSANRAGARAGRIVVVQSTAEGAPRALALNAQDGLFTLVERGLSGGAPLERAGLIGAISRALTADTQWDAVADVAARPETRVIISNVSEAGFRIDAPFPGRLTDALHARFTRSPDAPPVFVIPTELVPDNGPRLGAMVHELAPSQTFRKWLESRVRFCSSLVDRIVTMPANNPRESLEATLGYRDALLTVTEPYALWAIEADPAELRAVLPIESASVVFAPDIAFYRERKLRLLNAVHTATTPLALLAGVRIVREAIAHPLLGEFQKRLLFDEIIPATDIPADQALAFAHQVLERFANPWLEHEYRIIATNQEEKFRIRVLPLIIASFRRVQGTDKTPSPCLTLATAAHLRYTGAPLESLREAAQIPEFAAATTRWMEVLSRDGVGAALETMRCT